MVFIERLGSMASGQKLEEALAAMCVSEVRHTGVGCAGRRSVAHPAG